MATLDGDSGDNSIGGTDDGDFIDFSKGDITIHIDGEHTDFTGFVL